LKAAAAVSALAGFVRHPDRELREAALGALAQSDSDAALNAITPLLDDASAEFRQGAVTVLGEFKTKAALPFLLRAYQDTTVRAEATAALTRRPDLRAFDAYLDGLGSKNATLRERCRKALASVEAEALPLIETKVDVLSPEVLAELRLAFGSSDAARKSRLFAAPAKTLEPSDYLAFAVKNSGDSVRDKTLFFDAAGVACGKCHRVAGEGGDIGPDLSGAGSQFSREQLAESVLYPSRAVREGYNQVTVETKDGDEVSGLVRTESNEELVLRTADGNLFAGNFAEDIVEGGALPVPNAFTALPESE
jgi:quinoprotein glucose dehydrogenase